MRVRDLIPLPILMVAVTGCSLFEAEGFRIDATAVDDVAAAEDPAVVEVSVVNTGDTEVTWGRGSSTCRLHLLVSVEGTDRSAHHSRGACTMDLRTYRLDPGETYAATLGWDGRIRRNDSTVRVPPGVYDVRGVPSGRSKVDDRVTSNPVRIRVEEGS